MFALQAQAASAGEINVAVTGVKNASGQVLVCLWNAAGTFPDYGKTEPFKKQATAAAPGTVSVTFTGIPDGTYAISAWHDEDGNGKIVYGAGGKPTEGVGVSGSSWKSSGRPSYDESKFTLSGSKPVTVALQY